MSVSVDDLVRVVGPRVLPARALRESLAISPATLCRLVDKAGEQLYRLGRARAAAYARTRNVPEVGPRAPVFRIGKDGRPQDAGELVFLMAGGTFFSSGDRSERFDGLPPFAVDMSPQGYLGRGFGARFSELKLPARLADWSNDQVLVALARRGEDCAGDLVIGKESMDRWLASPVDGFGRDEYPARALKAGTQVGAMMGGDQAKFLGYVEGAHRLVKFVPQGSVAARARWRDLLECERLALAVISDADRPAADASISEVDGQRFLEVTRFDRVGVRGRCAVSSLAARSLERYGDVDTWTAASQRLQRDGSLPVEEARHLRWLDVFGQLIGNTDRHFGNVSFLTDGEQLRVAPAYDVAPVLFAPSDLGPNDRVLDPVPPTADTMDVWADAAHHAEVFWRRAEEDRVLSDDLRGTATRCRTRVAQARQRFSALVGT